MYMLEIHAPQTSWEIIMSEMYMYYIFEMDHGCDAFFTLKLMQTSENKICKDLKTFIGWFLFIALDY